MFDKKEWLANNIINKTYHCDKCDKSFRDRYNYKIHLTSLNHTGAYKRYTCSFKDCNYTSPSRERIESHEISRVHIKKYKRYICSFEGCGYMSISKKRIESHEQSRKHQ